MSSGGGEDESSGGGVFGKNMLKNPFSDWQKGGKWDAKAILNDVVQPIRIGVHYDFKEGRLKDSSLKHIEDISGRSAARKANQKAQNKINEDKATRAREADLLWLDNYRRDVAGSTQAQGMQASADARARTAGSSAAAGEKLGSSDEDLLGT